MNEQKWYQSKTKWGSILLAIGVGLSSQEAAAALPQLAAYAPLFQVAGMTLGGFGIRDAMGKKAQS